MSESLCQCPVITENGTVKYDIRKLICDYHIPFDETTLTVNISRWWPREQIERFALHLLGDKWQEEAEELRQLRQSNSELLKACRRIVREDLKEVDGISVGAVEDCLAAIQEYEGRHI